MIAVLVRVVVWLLAGHAVVGGLYWSLLLVPESNAWMLTFSALLVALVVVAFGWVETAAALTWTGRYPFGSRMRRALRGVPAMVVGIVVFGLVWWLTGWVLGWADDHRGEIYAALMARFGWTRTGWVHATIAWAVWVVRYPIGLSLGLAPLVAAAVDGFPALLRLGWVLRALAPVRLALTAVCLLAFVWLPWHAVYWRPKALPATWLQPAFVTAKLLIIYVLMNVGWALILKTAAWGSARPAAAAPPAPPNTRG